MLKDYNIKILGHLEGSLCLYQGKAVFLDGMTSEDKDFTIFQNVGKFSSKDTASRTRRSESSASTLLKLKILLDKVICFIRSKHNSNIQNINTLVLATCFGFFTKPSSGQSYQREVNQVCAH